jgi:hypothetical protein
VRLRTTNRDDLETAASACGSVWPPLAPRTTLRLARDGSRLTGVHTEQAHVTTQGVAITVRSWTRLRGTPTSQGLITPLTTVAAERCGFRLGRCLAAKLRD